MANKIKPDGLSQSKIYENGDLYNITVNDLKDNEIAIIQLLNDYNTKVKKIEELQESEKQLSAELQYQNVSPFFSILAALVNVIGSVISCCGVNFVTGEDNTKMGIFLVIAGGLLLLLGSIMTICYRHVYRWTNKPKVK